MERTERGDEKEWKELAELNGRRETANEVRDLLSKLLVIKPEPRNSVEEVLQHPSVNVWFDGPEINALSYFK
ncbi:unnamed protein product [Soboliphyme baturini]|uniref:Protein kinase domain-containing protein n=1 Tax=Soboliphyme baturini TaxID=241478 RepID=A0A183IA54_9BILA|nr:unnamed protein product [Soboliphyme baturini]